MKTIIKITLLSTILLLSSCNIIRVSSDFNDKINFNDYKTYAFSKKGVDEAEINIPSPASNIMLSCVDLALILALDADIV